MIHHRVDGLLECMISPRTSTVILRERSAVGDRDVTRRCCAPGRWVDAMDSRYPSKILPRARDAETWPAAELALGATSRATRVIRKRSVELIDHVDGFLNSKIRPSRHRDLAGKVAGADGVVTSAMLRTWQ